MSKIEIRVIPIEFYNKDGYLFYSDAGIKGTKEVIDYFAGNDKEARSLETTEFFAGLIWGCVIQKGLTIYDFQYKKARPGREDEVNIDVSDICVADIKMKTYKNISQYCRKKIELRTWKDKDKLRMNFIRFIDEYQNRQWMAVFL